MPTFQKRITASGEVRWRAIVRVAGAPARSQTFSNKAKARAWATKLEDDMRMGEYVPRVEARRHTVAEAIARLKKEKARAKKKLPRGRKAQLAWWTTTMGSLTLADVTPAKVRDAILRRKDLKPSSRNRYIAALSAVLESARRDWEWMHGMENPCHLVRKEEEPGSPGRTLTNEQLRRLLDAAKASDPLGRLYDLVVLALTTAARQGELLKLRLCDLQLEGDEPCAFVQSHDSETTHSKNEDARVLDLHGEALDVVNARADARMGWAEEHGFEAPEMLYLFGTHRRARGAPSFPSKLWQEARETAKVPSFRFHDLRHCAVSYLVMSGASLRDAMEFAGHRSAAMSKRYSHLARPHMREVTGKMVAKFLSDHPPDLEAEAAAAGDVDVGAWVAALVEKTGLSLEDVVAQLMRALARGPAPSPAGSPGATPDSGPGAGARSASPRDA